MHCAPFARYLLIFVLTATSGAGAVTDMRTPAQVDQFINAAGARIGVAGLQQNRANWVFTNFITHDTQQILITAKTRYGALAGQLAREASEAMSVPGLSPVTLRNLEIIRHKLVLPPPSSVAQATELATLAVELRNIYSTGKYC